MNQAINRDGAVVGSAWNYITNSAITWRRQ